MNLSTGLLLEPSDGCCDLPAQQRGVVPFRFVKRSRGDVFLHAVQLGCDRIVRIGDARPVGGKDLVGPAAKEERVGSHRLLDDELAHHLVPVFHRPTALLEAAIAVFVGAARPLHHSIKSQKGADHKFPHVFLLRVFAAQALFTDPNRPCGALTCATKEGPRLLGVHADTRAEPFRGGPEGLCTRNATHFHRKRGRRK